MIHWKIYRLRLLAIVGAILFLELKAQDVCCSEHVEKVNTSNASLTDMHVLERSVQNVRDQLLSYSGKSLNSTECEDGLSQYPIQAVDAFGKLRSGIIGENAYWLGNYHECTSLGVFQHCVADMDLVYDLNNGSDVINQQINWGICMPKSCNEDNIEMILSQVGNEVFHLSYPSGQQPASYENVHCNQIPDKSADAGFICVVLVCSILGLLMILGAAIDVYLKWSENARNAQGYETLRENIPLTEQGQDKIKKHGFVVRFLLCFAINRSLPRILSTKQGDSSIGCINGLRVISMFWIVLFHTTGSFYDEPRYTILVDNAIEYNKFIVRLGYTVLAQVTFAVDVFFLLSGCLVTYVTLTKMSKSGGQMNWALFYFHRYWRLTPVYASVILFLVFLNPYIGHGPMWYNNAALKEAELCHHYWWRNLLYINNFFPEEEYCYIVSWYLSTDMQLFAVSPILLILLYKFPKVGIGLLSFLVVICIAIRTGLTSKYGYILYGVMYWQPPGVNYQDFFENFYTMPWTRASPYLIGMVLGFVLKNKPDLRMRPLVVTCGWLLSLAVGLVVVYVLNNRIYREWSTAGECIYNGVSSTAFSLCIAWVILACANGYGGWINTFLSWSFWVPLGKLTFAVYLVHMTCIHDILYSNSNSLYFSMIQLSAMFTAILVLSYMAALMFALGIEFPFANLEKLLLSSIVKKKQRETTNMKEQQTIMKFTESYKI